MKAITTLFRPATAGVFLVCLSLLLLTVGCRDSASPPASSTGGGGHHHHEPPHGGTAITLGDEEAHVEFVLDATAGKMTAYILSPHMAGFLRIPQTSFEVSAQFADRQETLLFNAVATPATGETVGDTSQFEARADWLTARPTFSAVLKELTVKGKKFSQVAFRFP